MDKIVEWKPTSQPLLFTPQLAKSTQESEGDVQNLPEDQIGITWFPPLNTDIRVYGALQSSTIAFLPQASAEVAKAGASLKTFSWHDPDLVHKYRFPQRKKKNYISPPFNQRACGSCWAVATAGAFGGRLAIASDSDKPISVSVTEILSCDDDPSVAACGGGFPISAAKYIEKNGIGIESCSAYDEWCNDNACQEQSLPSCDDVKSQECKKRYKAKKGASRSIVDHKALKEEIFLHGPVIAGYIVYGDFAEGGSKGYWKETNNIYCNVQEGENPYGSKAAAQVQGGHAVEVVGWGVDENVPKYGKLEYWIVKNSWGTKWGADKDGYYKSAFSNDKHKINTEIGFDRALDKGGLKLGGMVACYPMKSPPPPVGPTPGPSPDGESIINEGVFAPVQRIFETTKAAFAQDRALSTSVVLIGVIFVVMLVILLMSGGRSGGSQTVIIGGQGMAPAMYQQQPQLPLARMVQPVQPQYIQPVQPQYIQAPVAM